MFSALLSALFSALFLFFTVWRIVGRGENPVGPGTPVSGGVRTRGLSWPSTAEYRQNDEIKKKKKGRKPGIGSNAACPYFFFPLSRPNCDGSQNKMVALVIPGPTVNASALVLHSKL